ncbi:MAG: hypothetical protein MH204_11955, partial [Fimbriimonadaceae bacterium]|nr:hypothetical protein [Fimbriimonadaceae bacterium]
WMLGGLARRPNSELPVRLNLEPLDRVNRPFQRDIEPLVRALRGESPLMEALARRPRDLAGLFTHERHLATALEMGPGDRWFRPSRGSAGFSLIRTEDGSAD